MKCDVGAFRDTKDRPFCSKISNTKLYFIINMIFKWDGYMGTMSGNERDRARAKRGKIKMLSQWRLSYQFKSRWKTLWFLTTSVVWFFSGNKEKNILRNYRYSQHNTQWNKGWNARRCVFIASPERAFTANILRALPPVYSNRSTNTTLWIMKEVDLDACSGGNSFIRCATKLVTTIQEFFYEHTPNLLFSVFEPTIERLRRSLGTMLVACSFAARSTHVQATKICIILSFIATMYVPIHRIKT